jgi:hypothetical protein
MRSPRRRCQGRSATTSATTRSPAGGTSTRRGAPAPGRPRRWTTCGSTRWSRRGPRAHRNRPSRGRRGKAFRRAATGIPTGKFRDRLTQMPANAGLAVVAVAVDPAYTSRWGAEHWLVPLRQDHPEISGHHAAAVVIGRRALGHRGRRIAGTTSCYLNRNGRADTRCRAAVRGPAGRG